MRLRRADKSWAKFYDMNFLFDSDEMMKRQNDGKITNEADIDLLI